MGRERAPSIFGAGATGPDATPVHGFVAGLLGWYRRQARDLPWRRRAGDAYAVWVSEIMLQQTRVEVVRSYYERFLERYPDIARLAAASEQEILTVWEGLGYYRRARSLHQAARWIVRERGGRLPARFAEWRQLPGVGAYTAGAVASICGGEAVPAVDGNARRVLERWLARTGSPGRRPRAAAIDRVARLLVRWSGAPGDWNQALMDLGARICLPRQPRCDLCPVIEWCRTGRQGGARPRTGPARLRSVPRVVAWAWLVQASAVPGWLARQRPADGRWGGLWEFPTCEGPAASVAEAWRRWVGWALPRSWGRVELPVFEHRLTHRLYEFRPVLVTPGVRRARDRGWPPGVVPKGVRQLGLLPMGVPHQRLRRLVLDPAELGRWLARARKGEATRGTEGTQGGLRPQPKRSEVRSQRSGSATPAGPSRR